MRSIGKRNITKLKALVAEEMSRGYTLGLTPLAIHDRIEARVPADWFDIWESAHDEIERVTSDEVFRILNTR